MHWVIIIIVILIILVFIISFLAATWIFWLTALLTLFIFIVYYKSHKVSGIQRNSGLAQVMIPELQNERINWHVDYNKLDMFAVENLSEMMFTGWILSMAIPVTLTYLLYSRGHLPSAFGVSTPDEFKDYLIFGLIIAGTINGIILAYYKPRKRFIDAVRNAAKDIKDRSGDSIEEIQKIKRIIDSMQEEAAKLKVSISVDYMNEIYDYINNNGRIIFQQPQRLEEFVSERFNLATDDLKKLQRMIEKFSKTENLYLDTVDHVILSGSVAFKDRVDKFGNTLHSDNLKLLVVEHHWDEFMEILDRMQTDLTKFKNIAMKYEPEEDNDIIGEITRENACKFLGIPPDSSLEEIKKTYRYFSKLWHPDQYKGSDTRMKKLNAISDYLKEKGL